MAGNYRTITGQFNNFLTDTPYKYGQVNIRLKQNSFTTAAGFPAYNKTIGLDSTGALPVGLKLWCNGDGIIVAEYEIIEPDGVKWSFTLNPDDGSPISVQALRAGGSVPSNPSTVNSLIASEISSKAVRYDAAQSLTNGQKAQARINIGVNETLIIAVSDETTALTTGAAKVTFRMPFGFTLSTVRASVTTAPSGSILIVDINESGTSIFSTRLSIDATEKTSVTAASAAVISDANLADDAEITIDIDQIGSSTAGAGLKVYLIGTRI